MAETYFMGLPTTRVMRFIAESRRARGDAQLAAMQGQQAQPAPGTHQRPWALPGQDMNMPARWPQTGPGGPGGTMPSAAMQQSPTQERMLANLGQLPAYKKGGMVGPGGQPIRPHLGANQRQAPQMGGEMAEGQIRDMMSQNPQVAQQIQQAAQQAMATGELTPQEVDMAVKLAKLALRDPSMYPQIRAFAIQNGLATEQDLPQEYDQGLVYALLMLGEALQAQSAGGMPGQQMPMGGQPMQGQQPQMPQSQGDGAVNITAHEGEYVIPKHVVGMKGREFFDNMVSKYDPNNPE